MIIKCDTCGRILCSLDENMIHFTSKVTLKDFTAITTCKKCNSKKEINLKLNKD